MRSPRRSDGRSGARSRSEHGPARAGDIRRNVSRVDKAAASLGYRAGVGLDEGLAETARWFETALLDPVLAGVMPTRGLGLAIDDTRGS